MTAVGNAYRRLDQVQRRRWFRVTATVLVLAVCGTVFGKLIAVTHTVEVQRLALIAALTGQSLRDGDPYAVSLNERGTVHVNGRTYGGERFLRSRDLLFDETGAIAVPGALASAMVADQFPGWAPRWLLEQTGTMWMLAVVTTAWLVLIVWMSLTVPFLLTVTGTGLAVAAAGLAGRDGAMWALGGIGLLTFTFVLLMRTALIVLDRPAPLFAVAHTVLKEASRTKVSLVFVIIILVLLPLLPLGLDAESPLRFQLQTYISRSLGFTFYLAAFLTLFLSCATVAFEIRDRQIWQTITKPVNRFSYLLGKWLGVITVNIVLLSIASVSTFTFIQYLRERPVAQGVRGFEDSQQVRDAVLTARIGSRPEYHRLSSEQLRKRLEDEIQRRDALADLDRVPVEVRQALAEEILVAHEAGQRTVPPNGADREFIFKGLELARREGSNLTLRYRFHIMRDDEHETFPALFVFNRNPELVVERSYVPTLSHVLSVPAELIREDGTLSVTVVNLYEPPPRRGAGALNFEAADFELLHKVGSFEGNFFRAVLVDWVKLSFLAMLGICCSTFLSFPVACLMSFTIFVAGTIGPFLALSLQDYTVTSVEAVDWSDVGMVVRWAFRGSIRFVATLIVYLLEAFGAYRPTQLLVEGRLIGWNMVAAGTIKVGVMWSGISLLIGYLAIRARQLAIYSGQG